MELIKCEKLKKIYKMGELDFEALKGIDLQISDGEFTALAGPSGSGKTTILNIIGCLDRPSAGKVYLEGEDTSAYSRKQLSSVRRKKMGFVFQSFNLIPVLTAFENVAYPLILNNIKAGEREKRVNKILTEVGLENKKDNFPHQLSGGQKQRVAIARALIHKPALVLADEPTANLDTDTGLEIIKLMKKLNREYNITFVFATHDKLIMNEVDRIIKIKDGNKVA